MYAANPVSQFQLELIREEQLSWSVVMIQADRRNRRAEAAHPQNSAKTCPSILKRHEQLFTDGYFPTISNLPSGFL